MHYVQKRPPSLTAFGRATDYTFDAACLDTPYVCTRLYLVLPLMQIGGIGRYAL